jgi:nucleotide-binding universal stress UspA family protein
VHFELPDFRQRPIINHVRNSRAAPIATARLLPLAPAGGIAMIDLKRILVPTDFSPTSAAALSYGIALARAFDAKLLLLHVPEHPGVAAEAEYPIGIYETMKNAANQRLGELLTRDQTLELDHEFAMRIGDAPDEIVRFAAERDIDLIVMGTHGREGVARVLMGSVAETVVRRANCPVLTVHYPEHDFVMEEHEAPTVRVSA